MLPHVLLDPSTVPTNIVFFDVDETVLKASHFLNKAAASRAAGPGSSAAASMPSLPEWCDTEITPNTTGGDAFALLIRGLCGARMGSYGGGRLRAVTHHQITDGDVEAVLGAAAVAIRLLSP